MTRILILAVIALALAFAFAADTLIRQIMEFAVSPLLPGHSVLAWSILIAAALVAVLVVSVRRGWRAVERDFEKW